MPYIKTRDETLLYVKDWGSGKPVILIHGWPLSSDTWDDTALVLANSGFRTIAYDRRGFGRSGQPWDGYEYDTFADDLADVIDATGAEDAAIVGFSMGGGEVARYLSRHNGKHVSRAALIGAVTPFMLKTDDNSDGVDQAVFDQIKDNITQDRAHFFGGFFRNFFGVGMVSHPVSNEVLEWARNLAMQAGLKPTLDCVDAFGTTDFRGDMAAFNLPTLIIHGTDDAIVPIDTSGRAAARSVPGAQFIEYEGGAHGLFATHKERLTEDLLAFLRS